MSAPSLRTKVGSVALQTPIIAASGTFGIRLELPNQDNEIPGGLKCSVRFFDDNEEAEYLSLHGGATDSRPDDGSSIIEQDGAKENTMLLCRRIGPFKDKNRLQQLMDALEDAINDYQVRDDISTTTAYQVTTEAFATEADAKQIETELKAAGIKAAEFAWTLTNGLQAVVLAVSG